jgi:hypothetical protein
MFCPIIPRILEKSVETQKYAHVLNMPKKSKKELLTLACSCIREINASLHKTNKVGRLFSTSLFTLPTGIVGKGRELGAVVSSTCTPFSR